MQVLIVGNGFDRKIGLKTDYNSFLDWMREKGYGVGQRFSEYSNKINSHFLAQSESRIKDYKSFAYKSFEFSGERFNILNEKTTKHFEEQDESYLANCLLFLLPEITNNNTPYNTKNPNIWYCFIQLLRHQKQHNLFNIDVSKFEKYIGEEGNWVDIEGLIQKSIESRIQEDYYKAGIFSLSRYFDVFSLANLLVMDLNENHQRPKEDIYKLVWTDFLEFKKTFCGYLTSISNKVNNVWAKFESGTSKEFNDKSGGKSILSLTNYHKIINFNYTNFWPEKPDVYYVHGNIDDLSNVVFGLDMNIRGGEFQKDERKTTFEINLHKNKELLKFSKISQLLHLQVDKKSNPLGKTDTLSIIGHSIGEQDYSYYFSILDRNVDFLQINCLWYEYNEVGNNKESMKDALFEMLTSYEKYSNQRILHKMIFEGRIKFEEVFIPRIFNQ